MTMTHTIFESVAARVGQLDWSQLVGQLDEQGFAVTKPVLSAEECVRLADLFDGDEFRSTIDMARHRFGDQKPGGQRRNENAAHGWHREGARRDHHTRRSVASNCGGPLRR